MGDGSQVPKSASGAAGLHKRTVRARETMLHRARALASYVSFVWLLRLFRLLRLLRLLRERAKSRARSSEQTPAAWDCVDVRAAPLDLQFLPLRSYTVVRAHPGF